MKKTLLERVEVGSGGAASITFTSIDQSYDALVVLVSDRSNRAAVNDAVILKLNGTTSTGRRMYGSGSSITATSAPDPISAANTSTANAFSNIQFVISNYSSTTKYKPWLADGAHETNATLAYATLATGVYSSNSAVTSITLTPETGTGFLQYSSAALYGVTFGSIQ